MFGIATLSGPARAGALVGVVLGEALVLYVGYGTVFRMVGDEVKTAIEER
ncbi:MAG: hypothetical protein ABEJ67_01400 [Halanaeroarchaeum sp.]